MHRVLQVQGMGGARHGHAQAANHIDVQRLWCIQPMLQCSALDVLHHQVGHALQIAGRDKARYMDACEHLLDLALHFKANDIFCTVTGGHARHFHGHGKPRVVRALRIGDVVNVGHAAAVNAFTDSETVELAAQSQQFHRPISRREANISGSPARRMASAAATWS